jgi:hypothetical protein
LSDFLKTSFDVKATEHAMKENGRPVEFEPFSLDGSSDKLLLADRKSNL